MEPGTIIISLIAAAAGLLIFYFIIKAAVRNGVIEAKREQLADEERVAKKQAVEAEVAKSTPPSGEIW